MSVSGYEFGRPIITGRAVIENETLGEGYVDMNESSRISLWNPGNLWNII